MSVGELLLAWHVSTHGAMLQTYCLEEVDMRRLMWAALLALVACSSDKSTGPTSITGSYSLHTVNGSAPPAPIAQSATTKIELTAGDINLNADNTWSGALVFRTTDLTTAAVTTDTLTADGAYDDSAGSLTLAENGALFPATADSGTLTVMSDVFGLSGLTLLFQR